MTMSKLDRWIEGGWDAEPLNSRIRKHRLLRERGQLHEEPLPASDAMPEGQFYYEHGWHAGQQGRPVTEIDDEPPHRDKLRAIWLRGYAAGMEEQARSRREMMRVMSEERERYKTACERCADDEDLSDVMTPFDLIDVHDTGDDPEED